MGIGLPHSSSVANATFTNSAESRVISVQYMISKGVRGFWRYEDDLLLYGTCVDGAHARLAITREDAQFYEITAEKFSRTVPVLFS